MRVAGPLPHPANVEPGANAIKVSYIAETINAVVARRDRAAQGGFNRSSQHFVYRSLVALRREFPPVFSSRGFSEAWC